VVRRRWVILGLGVLLIAGLTGIGVYRILHTQAGLDFVLRQLHRIPGIQIDVQNARAQLARQQAERAAAMQSQRTPNMPAVHFVHEKYQSNGGFSMILVLLFLIGAAMAIMPWFLLTIVPQLTWGAAALISIIGVIILIAVATIVMFTRLYRRAAANLAFVRTGSGGARVIKDTGKLVVPVMHQVIPVSLETMRLNV